MPTIPKAASSVKNPKIESLTVDPKEVAAIASSVAGKKEAAPSVAEQSGSNVNWKQIQDALGQPYNIERIPLKKLRQMRLDAMTAFGLHYRKTPLVRAKWHMDARDKTGPNAQVAGFVDAAWRAIHARYVFQHTLDFDFGFSGIVKRFVQGNPGGYYIDPSETDPEKQLKPVWDEGTIEPIIWKPFVALPPEKVVAEFNNAGEFDGFTYTPPENVQQKARGSSSNKDRKIDVYHALWATNMKDDVFGNIYGYPLIAHGYRFWWSYWFLWANLDRAFERMAVPPMVAYHPEGEYTDLESGDTQPYWEIAMEAAERLRSNSIAAVPSTLATAGLDEKGTQMREWEFKFIETPVENFDAIHAYLAYLDVMKLRAIWVPELAFVEGGGGTSSRNVAAQMGEIFMESQANKWEEIADHINRFIIPQILVVNFPEFVNNGGTCRIIGHGFETEDVEFNKQLIQLIGQADPSAFRDVDTRTLLDRIGTPLLTPAQAAAKQQQLIDESAAAGPPTVDPNGAVGVIANPRVNGGSTNGGSVPSANDPGASVTGFGDNVYINPRAYIELSDHDDFLADLPVTSHYSDKTMRALAVQLRKTWQGMLREMYPDFAKFVASKQEIALADVDLDGDVAMMTFELSDDDDGWELEPDIGLAVNRNRRKATRAANKLIKEWVFSSKRLEQAAKSTRTILEKMVVRSAKIIAKSKRIDYQAVADDYNSWLDAQIGKLVKSVAGTTKANLRAHLIYQIMDGKNAVQIGDSIRDHFTEFPDWRADRIARSETKDAYNAGTLIVSEAAGVKYVKAKDAQLGPTDEHCEKRNGKLFTIKEAWKQMGPTQTHPNDTLEFEPIARATFSVKSVEVLPDDAPEGAEAWFDISTDIAYVPIALSDDDSDEFLSAVADHVLEAA